MPNVQHRMVVAGDLVDTLTYPGPFAVFVPANDDFAASPEGWEMVGDSCPTVGAQVVAGDLVD